MENLLLELKDVKAYYVLGNRFVRAVDGISLEVKDDIVGIVGESGSGKSTLTNIMLMSVKRPLTFAGGSVKLYSNGDEIELSNMDREELKKKIWGREISIIPQSAMNALMPTKRIRSYILDVMKSHFDNVNEEEITKKAVQRFEEIGIAGEFINRYPFELSGGMKQRAVIAVATLLNPRILIADEPTSALDVATQKMVLKTIKELKDKKIVKSVVFITHDIATVRQIADRIVVMYAGKIVEEGRIEEIITEPLHPYTKGLLYSVVTPEPEVKKRGIVNIPGTPPDLVNPPSGCRFHPRCPNRMEICDKEEPLLKNINNRKVACFLYEKR